MEGVESIIAQLEQQRTAIENAISALRAVTPSGEVKRTTSKPAASAGRRKHRISPEGRQRIAEAARRRWAAKKSADAAKQSGKAGAKNGRRSGKRAGSKRARKASQSPA